LLTLREGEEEREEVEEREEEEEGGEVRRRRSGSMGIRYLLNFFLYIYIFI
jgi:hypothetical protein